MKVTIYFSEENLKTLKSMANANTELRELYKYLSLAYEDAVWEPRERLLIGSCLDGSKNETN